MRIRVGGRAVHVPLVGEEVLRAPQQLDPRLGLELLGEGHHRIEVVVALGQGRALRSDVAVVKAVVVYIVSYHK